jgi:hypothetical protein
MAGLVPAIQVLPVDPKTWMPGTRPGMTTVWAKIAALSAASHFVSGQPLSLAVKKALSPGTTASSL